MKKLLIWLIPVVVASLLPMPPASARPQKIKKCAPTPPDMLGPFYKPDAPMRSSVGKGYVLTGTVRSTRDCS